MKNNTDKRKFCCERFERDYKHYNNYPNVRVVRLVSEKFSLVRIIFHKALFYLK